MGTTFCTGLCWVAVEMGIVTIITIAAALGTARSRALNSTEGTAQKSG